MALRKRNKNKRLIHIFIMSVAIVTFWWGVWGTLDWLFQFSNPIWSYLIGVSVALLILYLDDFHLKELE
ncbi:MAG: hypothetical protein M3Q44_06665 [bacterium]|nr:hypothetical protein [bacterium]